MTDLLNDECFEYDPAVSYVPVTDGVNLGNFLGVTQKYNFWVFDFIF